MDDYKTNDLVALTARCTLEELAQILSDYVDRIVVWDQPSLDAVASVSVNGNSVQLNVESSDQPEYDAPTQCEITQGVALDPDLELDDDDLENLKWI